MQRVLLAVLVMAGLGSACGAPRYVYREPADTPKVERWAVLKRLSLGRALEDRILALDPERITEKDVRTILSRAPSPRILNVHGGVPASDVMMASFSEFLMGMGYPEERIRHPKDGSVSCTPYEASTTLAERIAWYYEQEEMRVMLVGHSLGGIQAVKVLDGLAGEFNDQISVWNPVTEEAEDRTTVVDPLTGHDRPVVGLQVAYATAVGAGGGGMLLPNEWSVLGRLESIPETVQEFTGFVIGVDLFAWDFAALGAATKFHADATARVRNVLLPASYNHLTVPATAHLAKDEKIREWINAYVPTDRPELTLEFGSSSDGILWAADVWHSIKRHWCLEAQRLIRARRMMFWEQ